LSVVRIRDNGVCRHGVVVFREPRRVVHHLA
jgi:hypothetical protein